MCRCTGCCGRPGRHHGRRQQLPVGGVAAACGRSGTLWRTARHQAVTRAARARRRTFSRPQRRSRKPSGPRPRRRRRQRRRPRLPPAGPRPQDAGLAEAAPGAKRQKTGGWAQDEEVRVISSSRAPNVTRAALGLEEWELYVSPHRCHFHMKWPLFRLKNTYFRGNFYTLSAFSIENIETWPFNVKCKVPQPSNHKYLWIMR